MTSAPFAVAHEAMAPYAAPPRMRRLLFFFVFVACSCVPQGKEAPPPDDRFYYPTALSFVRNNSVDGVLLVASGNVDRRYAFSSLMAVPLSQVGAQSQGLPPMGEAVPASGPRQIHGLNVSAEQRLHIGNFAGQMAQYPMVDTLRLFLTSRGEGSLVHIVDAQLSPALSLSCHGDAASRDCRGSALSLAEDFPSEKSGGPVSAPLPFGVAVGGSTVFVTHLTPVDSPVGSGLNPQGFLVHFPAGEPPAPSEIRDSRYFTSIGATTAHAVASDGRFAFFTGRPNNFNPQAVLLRWSNAQGTVTDGALLESFYRAVETRGIAVSDDLLPNDPAVDERRLFIAGRTPDTLVVLKLTVSTDSSGNATAPPRFFLERAVSLPPGPNEMVVIERDNKRPVVAVSCENFLLGSDPNRGEVVFYDDEVGQLVARVRVGSQPFGLAVDKKSNSARIFAANFGDGRIAVIDMPNVDAPQDVRAVAHVGLPHVCLDSPSDATCQETP